MKPGDLPKRRRCRMLLLAMTFGVLLPLFQPSAVTVTVGAVGIAILAVVYWRDCRRRGGTEPTQGGTHV